MEDRRKSQANLRIGKERILAKHFGSGDRRDNKTSSAALSQRRSIDYECLDNPTNKSKIPASNLSAAASLEIIKGKKKKRDKRYIERSRNAKKRRQKRIALAQTGALLKPANNITKNNPEAYWRQWWPQYVYMEKLIPKIDPDDVDVKEFLKFSYVPTDRKFNERMNILLNVGVKKISRNCDIDEINYEHRDVYKLFLYKKQLEDPNLHKYLNPVDKNKVLSMLGNLKHVGRWTLMLQCLVSKWDYYRRQLIGEIDTHGLGMATKMFKTKMFHYLVMEAMEELKRLCANDWNGFNEFYEHLLQVANIPETIPYDFNGSAVHITMDQNMVSDNKAKTNNHGEPLTNVSDWSQISSKNQLQKTTYQSNQNNNSNHPFADIPSKSDKLTYRGDINIPYKSDYISQINRGDQDANNYNMVHDQSAQSFYDSNSKNCNNNYPESGEYQRIQGYESASKMSDVPKFHRISEYSNEINGSKNKILAKDGNNTWDYGRINNAGNSNKNQYDRSSYSNLTNNVHGVNSVGNINSDIEANNSWNVKDYQQNEPNKFHSKPPPKSEMRNIMTVQSDPRQNRVDRSSVYNEKIYEKNINNLSIENKTAWKIGMDISDSTKNRHDFDDAYSKHTAKQNDQKETHMSAFETISGNISNFKRFQRPPVNTKESYYRGNCIDNHDNNNSWSYGKQVDNTTPITKNRQNNEADTYNSEPSEFGERTRNTVDFERFNGTLNNKDKCGNSHSWQSEGPTDVTNNRHDLNNAYIKYPPPQKGTNMSEFETKLGNISNLERFERPSVNNQDSYYKGNSKDNHDNNKSWTYGKHVDNPTYTTKNYHYNDAGICNPKDREEFSETTRNTADGNRFNRTWNNKDNYGNSHNWQSEGATDVANNRHDFDNAYIKYPPPQNNQKDTNMSAFESKSGNISNLERSERPSINNKDSYYKGNSIDNHDINNSWTYGKQVDNNTSITKNRHYNEVDIYNPEDSERTRNTVDFNRFYTTPNNRDKYCNHQNDGPTNSWREKIDNCKRFSVAPYNKDSYRNDGPYNSCGEEWDNDHRFNRASDIKDNFGKNRSVRNHDLSKDWEEKCGNGNKYAGISDNKNSFDNSPSLRNYNPNKSWIEEFNNANRFCESLDNKGNYGGSLSNDVEINSWREEYSNHSDKRYRGKSANSTNEKFNNEKSSQKRPRETVSDNPMVDQNDQMYKRRHASIANEYNTIHTYSDINPTGQNDACTKDDWNSQSYLSDNDDDDVCDYNNYADASNDLSLSNERGNIPKPKANPNDLKYNPLNWNRIVIERRDIDNRPLSNKLLERLNSKNSSILLVYQKGPIKPNPRNYWKKWWTKYVYIENSIDKINENDPDIQDHIYVKTRKLTKTILQLGGRMRKMMTTVTEENFEHKSFYEFFKFRILLRSIYLNCHHSLRTKELQNLVKVLHMTNNRIPLALMLQSVIDKWHRCMEIIKDFESAKISLTELVADAYTLKMDKLFNYITYACIKELQEISQDDWPGFYEFYYAIQ
ncbi:uncharacterized protein LOC142226382 isoform X2 [Haematobia irritans]|uniref:uncharacterized protein LOC142226382 isoform X2 n=1 Tax=Haematobia irritans TaxID=7368 RepID=UPI003F509110